MFCLEREVVAFAPFAANIRHPRFDSCFEVSSWRGTKQGWVSLQFLLNHALNIIKKLTSPLSADAWKDAMTENSQHSFYPTFHTVWISPPPNGSKL